MNVKWTSLIYPLVHIIPQTEPTRPIPCILPTGGGPECFLIWSNTRNNSTHISILLVILPNLDHQFHIALIAHMKSGPYESDSTTQNLFPIYSILFIFIHLPQIIIKFTPTMHPSTCHDASQYIINNMHLCLHIKYQSRYINQVYYSNIANKQII